MKRLHFISLLVIAANCVAQDAVQSASGCPDLTGRYKFSGSWYQHEIEGRDTRSLSRYKANLPKPDLAMFAFAVNAYHLVNPRFGVIRHSIETGNVLLNIEAEAADEKKAVFAPKLPVEIHIRCIGTAWQLDYSAAGGGENVPTVTKRQILLWTNENGDLLAKGYHELIKGLVFKDKTVETWVALFKRDEEKLLK